MQRRVPLTLLTRVCIFGAVSPTTEWLANITQSVPSAVRICLLGTSAAIRHDDPRIERYADIVAMDAMSVLPIAVAKFPGDDLILLRSGTALPPLWYERLQRALAETNVLVATPLDNVDTTRSPLAENATSHAHVNAIDALCYAYGRRQLLDWPTFSPLLSAWSGTRLRGMLLEQIQQYTMPQNFAPLRTVLLDHLYVADPTQTLRGPPPVAAGADPLPASALGELRENITVAIAHIGKNAAKAFYPGLDSKPVLLHVLHGWGGGAERFVRDLASADSAHHHLVLIARGNFHRRHYGEILELYDGALTAPPLRRLVLPCAINSTALTETSYAAFLSEILREFGIDAIMISSLIGHSLDALRTNLPTLIIGHDYYPLWPLLHCDFGDTQLAFDDVQLASELAQAGTDFEFAERHNTYWHALREAYVTAVHAANATLIAPSSSMLANLLRLEPRLTSQHHAIIAHGLAPWPTNTKLPLPAPAPRPRMRLVMLGRIRHGKGAQLLRAALPGLREHAELFLVGTGAAGEQFFGEQNVHIVLNYQRDELPGLLAQIAPDAALLLPTVAETFSYTLSELASLGIPAIATRIGALAERIEDHVNGWLVDAQADAVITAVAHLHADHTALVDARTALAQLPKRTLVDMAADYCAQLPLVPQSLARYALNAANTDRIIAQTRAAELGASKHQTAALQSEFAAQQHELDKRTDWALGLERELRTSRQAILPLREQIDTLQKQTSLLREQTNALREQANTLQEQIEERTRWAQSASDREIATREELTRLAQIHQQLQNEFDARTRWAKTLDADLAAMHESTSWQITKPLRFIVRALRAARAHCLFTLRHLSSIFSRTRGSVASRGMAGTLKRIRAEFHNNARLPPATLLEIPRDEFVPFAIPLSMEPRVSIVIPVYSKFKYTNACLHSIVEHATTTAFEVIVVDDASSDATPERLAGITGIRTIRNPQNLGFIGSCNAGAAIAKGEYLIFLNNDTVVTAGWIEALLCCFAEQSDAGLVGAKLVYPDGRLQEAGGIVFRDGSGWNYGRFDDPADPRYNFRREADYCSGAAIMLSRMLFNELGGFDSRYAPAYYEDTDLAFAVRAAGKKVYYEPRATVIHFEGVTSGTDITVGTKQYQAINRRKFLEKWKDALARQPAPISDPKQAALAITHTARGRILIVDASTPMPDHDAGSLRMVNLISILRDLGYAIDFLPDNRAHAGCYTEALQALGVQALYHPYVTDPVAWLRDHGSELNTVVLSRHYVAMNYIGLVRLYAPQARLIFDTVDLHYLREERAARLSAKPELMRHATRTKIQELKVMRECDMTLVVSIAEKELLTHELPQARIEIVSTIHKVYGCRKVFADRRDLVFVGGFQHPPNVDAVHWFVREVFPQVRAMLPGVKFHVIGSKAPADVLALAHDDVIVHGYVDDIAPLMDSCRISVAPLRYGAGIKGKVNMAMSYGLPVVATSIAVEGMHVCSGEEVLTADSASEFAAAIQRAYTDETLWKKLSDNGLENVRQHFSFETARQALQRIFPSHRQYG